MSGFSNKVMPTIFALNVETFEKKLEILEFADEIHLDFMDGEFTQDKSVAISDMHSIMNFPNKRFQIHLMARNPGKYIDQIRLLGINSVLIHEEVFKSVEELGSGIRQFKDLGFELYVVLNPNTDFDRIRHFYDLIDGIMIMGVVPGAEGQRFYESTFEKIRMLVELVGGSFPILVDGGVSDVNARELVECGANVLCVGSFISSAKTPKSNYEKLVNLINF